MAKRCVIITERYRIEVTSFNNPIQDVTVEPLEGMKGFAISGIATIGKANQNNEKIKCLDAATHEYLEYKSFWNYIVSIIEDTMKWQEYWKHHWLVKMPE